MIKIVHFLINLNNKASVVPWRGTENPPAQQNAPGCFSSDWEGGFPWKQKQIKIENPIR